MIENFEDFCTWLYVTIDDIWQRIAPLFQRPGPAPMCSDSEVLTIAIVSECKGWQNERELPTHWAPYLALFPHFPERSRFNRRRRNLSEAFNWVRWVVLHLLDLAQDHHCLVDDLPVEVVKFHLVPTMHGDWREYGASYGWVASKKRIIFGYKLHLLINLNGVIIDFALAPANANERAVAEELLFPYTDLLVVGDKAYVSQPFQHHLQTHQRITVLAPPRRNQKQQLPPALRLRLSQARQLIETVNQQLTDQFHIQHTPAHTFYGLCARLHTKLAAHTLCLYLNRLLGNPDWLQIKALAFSN